MLMVFLRMMKLLMYFCDSFSSAQFNSYADCELLSDCLRNLRVLITEEVEGKKVDGTLLFDINDVENSLHSLKFGKAAIRDPAFRVQNY